MLSRRRIITSGAAALAVGALSDRLRSPAAEAADPPATEPATEPPPRPASRAATTPRSSRPTARRCRGSSSTA